MKLPKLYRPVTITFWSLRNALGSGGGVIFGVDKIVRRKAMRVRCNDGWKWQICDIVEMFDCDYFVYDDQEILTEYRRNDELGGIESWEPNTNHGLPYGY